MTSLSTHHLGYRYLKYQLNSFSHSWMHKLTKLRSRVIWSFQCLPELRLGSIMTKDSIHQPHIHESKISSRNKRNLYGLLQQLNGLTQLHRNFRHHSWFIASCRKKKGQTGLTSGQTGLGIRSDRYPEPVGPVCLDSILWHPQTSALWYELDLF